MTTHRFDPDRFHNSLGTTEPVLAIADGDTVVTTTLDDVDGLSLTAS